MGGNLITIRYLLSAILVVLVSVFLFCIVSCNTSPKKKIAELTNRNKELSRDIERLIGENTKLEKDKANLVAKNKELENNLLKQDGSDFELNVVPHEPRGNSDFELDISPAETRGKINSHYTDHSVLRKGDSVPFTAAQLNNNFIHSDMVGVNPNSSITNNYQKNDITFTKGSYIVLRNGTRYESAEGCRIKDSVIISGSISVYKNCFIQYILTFSNLLNPINDIPYSLGCVYIL